uniref:Uncharacterized protein n=1 Tax=Noccaea caerulescens TaxID=107243 RepID=A0A1J3JEJ8_NOCCA
MNTKYVTLFHKSTQKMKVKIRNLEEKSSRRDMTNMLHQCLLDYFFPCTDNTIDNYTFFHEDKSRHCFDFEFLSNGLQFVNIDLEEDDIEKVPSHLYKDWCNETTRWTPCRSEVYHDQFLGFVGNFDLLVPDFEGVASDDFSFSGHVSCLIL